MPTKKVCELRATNREICQAIWNDASQEYQHRIPNPDQGDIAEQFNRLFDRQYKPQLNEFVDALVNRIGDVVFRSKSWSNPWAKFKRGMLNYGDTIEEVATGLVKAKRFDPNCVNDNPFKPAPFDAWANYHSINRQDQYRIEVRESMLRRAFVDENGLSTFVNQVMNIPYVSDEVDEFLIMRNLLAEVGKRDGFYKVQAPNVMGITDPTSLRQAGEKITILLRSILGRLGFMSGQYNSTGVPTFTKPDEAVLIATPEFFATLDVTVLAQAFNVSEAQINAGQVVLTDTLGIDGAQAALVDESFFLCADTYIGYESIYNPAGRNWFYYLNHDGIYSASLMANAILYTTEPGTIVTVPDIDVTEVTVSLAPLSDGTAVTFAERGGVVRMLADVAGTVDPEEPGYMVDQAVAWTITATDGKPLRAGTYIDAEGVLHVDCKEPNNAVTVTATSAYINPNKPLSEQTYHSGSLVVGIGKAYVPPEPEEPDEPSEQSINAKSESKVAPVALKADKGAK